MDCVSSKIDSIIVRFFENCQCSFDSIVIVLEELYDEGIL